MLPTPAASYTYDQSACLGQVSCYNTGRRTGMTDGGGSEASSYDQMGRVLTDRRTTNSVTKSISYAYNLDGSMKTLTYPSGRVITYTIGGAGRPLSAVDSSGVNYALSATYAPPERWPTLCSGKRGALPASP